MLLERNPERRLELGRPSKTKAQEAPRVAPLGIPLVPPTSGDTILYAECQADMIKVWKAIIDTVGHYARPDIVRLQYMKSAEPSLAEIAVEALEKKSPDELEAVAERQGLGRQELESAIERLAR
jgi:hypothetical protein